ncbi:MAG: DUF3991 and toprim domain-containing protein [Treponema sp.]|nr:DUF3991 and toprim domain-containing protein [Treponema sp.]
MNESMDGVKNIESVSLSSSVENADVGLLPTLKNTSSHSNQTFDWNDISAYRNANNVERYLEKVRHIGLGIVDFLLRNNLLYQEERTNNAVFPIHDEHNAIVGAELCGITSKPFKGVAGGGKYGYGLNVRFSESEDNTFDYALFFESAIDLLSYIDYKVYHKDERFKNCLLVSMMGLKPNILKHSLEVFAPDAKAVLCVDNDNAGRNFINKVDNLGIDYALRLPDEKYKDWNEQIIDMKRYCNPIGRALERARESLQIL